MREQNGFKMVWFMIKRIVLCVLLMNGLFYSLLASRMLVRTETINMRVLHAFLTEDLLFNDWPAYDSLRGVDQFSDAVMLMQMQVKPKHAYGWITPSWPRVANDASNPASNTPLGSGEITYSRSKALLWLTSDVRMSLNRGRPYTPSSIQMYRYWEGTLPINAWLLVAFDLKQVRLIIFYMTCFALMLLGPASLTISREAFVCFIPIMLFGLLFSGLPFFGQLMMHMGFGIGLLTIVCLLIVVARIQSLGPFVCACSIAGSIAVFVDQLNGVSLQMMCLLIPSSFFLARARRTSLNGIGSNRVVAVVMLTGCFSFIFGGLLSLCFHYALQGAFYGYQEVFGSAYSQLIGRMNDNAATLGDSYGTLHRHLDMIAYGNRSLAEWMLVIGIAGWIFGLPSFVKSVIDRIAGKHNEYYPIFMVNFLAAMVVLIWYAIFRSHTKIHGWFMVRYFYLPYALGWSNIAYLWFAYSRQKRSD